VLSDLPVVLAPSVLQVDPTPLFKQTLNAIMEKRRQNTVAARISRQRKAEHLKHLETEVERLHDVEKQMLEWKKRAEEAEARLKLAEISV
jgi:UDP-glucose 4-epimerase